MLAQLVERDRASTAGGSFCTMKFRKHFFAAFIGLIACHARWLQARCTTQPVSAPLSTRNPLAVSSTLFLEDDDDDDDKPKSASSPSSNPAAGRYFLGLLDHRSSYGKDFFPDTFLGPEFDVEKQIELDYAHAQKAGSRIDEVDAEFQWNVVGELMVAGDFGWTFQHASRSGGGAVDDDGGINSNASGLDDVSLAIYHPIIQYVSGDGAFDYTVVARTDVGIPTRTAVSTNDLELTPYFGQLARIGDHVSLEAWTGSQFTIAPHQTTQLIYGASLGYVLSHDQLRLPYTETTTPLLELDGQSPLSGNEQDALFGVAGVAWQMQTSGEIQPAIMIGYQFPIDQGARNESNWGIIATFFLQF